MYRRKEGVREHNNGTGDTKNGGTIGALALPETDVTRVGSRMKFPVGHHLNGYFEELF